MKKVTGSEFRSDFGFSSPSFTVDSLGNLSARSITTIDDDTAEDIFDFVITDDEGGDLLVEGKEDTFPSLTLAKTQSYKIQIDLDNTSIFFYQEDEETFYTDGLRHSSGEQGASAQGQSGGFYTVNIPAGYSQEVIYYTNELGITLGEISVVDPEGVFSSVEITGENESTGINSGALTVKGGVGVEGALNANSITVDSIALNTISSNGSFSFVSDDKIDISTTNGTVFLGSDSSVIGTISNQGSTIPLVDTTATTVDIDNSDIGLNSPSAARFTTAEVLTQPTTDVDIANKQYTDTQAIVYSIALGF